MKFSPSVKTQHVGTTDDAALLQIASDTAKGRTRLDRKALAISLQGNWRVQKAIDTCGYNGDSNDRHGQEYCSYRQDPLH